MNDRKYLTILLAMLALVFLAAYLFRGSEVVLPEAPYQIEGDGIRLPEEP